MGKIEKKKAAPRHDPLHVQMELHDSTVVPDPTKGRGAVRRARNQEKDSTEEEKERFVSDKLSKKILLQARKQQEEIEREEKGGEPKKKLNKQVRQEEVEVDDGDESIDEDLDENEEDYERAYQTDLERHLSGLNPEDEAALSMFMSKEVPTRRTLADEVLGRIKEKETEIMTLASEKGELTPQKTLNPKVVAVYEGVGKILSRYRSGKLPKAFKIIPSLANWEEILYITNPDSWSTQAMYQATRIFVSNFNAKMAQRFFNLVLLPKITEDFQLNKKLNYHLYMSLKKSLFKPAAFFKGILLPLCESQNCTLREAAIVASVLSKVSIPVLHSSAALLKIAEMEYSGTNSMFIRVLLDKKYALPYRVLDSLVFHFLRFENDKRVLPVLWHQALLVFVQRYKEDLTHEQKEAILGLIRKQTHFSITHEIRRELINSRNRGEAPVAPEEMDMDLEDLD